MDRQFITKMNETNRHIYKDDTVEWLMKEAIRNGTGESTEHNLKLALDYAAAYSENIEDRKQPWKEVIVRLDENDYDDVYKKFPESKKVFFVSCDLQHLYERIKLAPIKFGNTKLLILNLKYNPIWDLKTKDINVIAHIAELFGGKDYDVRWGLVQTNCVVRVGVELIYQE